MKKYIIAFLIGFITMSYLDIGFNDNLTTNDNTNLQLNPLQTQSVTTDFAGENIGSQIQGQYIGDGIKANNITTGKMSFDRAQGGTLTLGGANNVSGVLSLKDDSNLERIVMNKDGMTINNGSLTVKDATNKSTLDAAGLVSTSAFKSNSIRSSAQSSTTSSALFLTQITDLSFNITVARTTNILIILSTIGKNDNNGAGGLAFVGIALDGARVTTLAAQSGVYLNSTPQNCTATIAVITGLTPGNHNIIGFFGRGGGTGNALVDADSQLSYVLLGN